MMPVASGQAPENVDLLIENALVLRSDGTLTKGRVACTSGLISSVEEGRTLVPLEATRVIDAGGGILHPGLTDAHFHAPLLATRNLLDTRGSRDVYFKQYVAWFEVVDPETEYLSSVAASIEALSNGVTSFIEPGTAIEPDAVARAADEVGVRCSVGDSFVWDRSDFWMAAAIGRRPLTSPDHEVGTQLFRNTPARNGSLARGHIALYGSASASAELISAAHERATEAGTFLTMHQSPTVESSQIDATAFGAPPVVHLNRLGVLGDSIVLAHMNSLEPTEADALRDSTATIAWCPANAIAWGMAAASPLPHLTEDGVNIAFGSDLPKTWSLGDQISIASLQARSVGVDLTPETVFDSIFTRVPRLMGLSGSRGVEVGSVADLVVRKPWVPEQHPSHDVMGHLSIAKQKTVDRVIVNGRVVYEDGSTTVDEESVLRHLGARCQRLLASL